MALLNCCPKKKNKGLSLLELIVAVAVLSSGVLVVLQAFSTSSRAAAISKDTMKAVLIAQDTLQEIEFKRQKNIITEGSLKGKRDKYDWGYTIAQDPDSKLYKLDIDIAWLRAAREDKISLTTYLR